MIAISLLFHNSLISMYLVEWADIAWEYYFSNTVLANSLWDATIPSNVNAMLSISILPPIFAEVCNLNLTWVFKIIYPLLYSLVPLGIYYVVRQQTADKIAFLASFFFMSMFGFFTDMLGLARQQIAELFLVLLLLLLIDKRIGKSKKVGLSIAFSFCLVVSHYGLSSMFLLILIGALGLLSFKIWDKKQEKKNMVTLTFVALYITLVLAWAMNITGSSIFHTLVFIGSSTISDITHFLDPRFAQGLYILLGEPITPLGQLHKIIHLITQFFIAVGILMVLLNQKQRKIEREYLALAVLAFGFCLAGLAIPHFAATVNTSRLYHITLLFLSPFCVIGGIAVFSKAAGLIKNLVKTQCANTSTETPIKVLSVFFAIYLLFNSGLINEIVGQPISFSLSKTEVSRPHFNEQEFNAARWLKDNRGPGTEVHADLYNAHLTMMLLGSFSPLMGEEEVITPISDESYIFLGWENIMDGKIRLSDPGNPRLSFTVVSLQDLEFQNTLLNINRIYDSGGAQIYR
ncbi:MAG: hypothetical protein DDT40_01490 [candidate division WS2 bacterium]|nr:hypothetical protein [Candidatus Psychracetigena formicireducens]